MAFYIIIEKIEETDFLANYRFKINEDKMGLFQINKKNGEVLLIKAMPDDEKSHYFNRAAVKIIREWKQGKLPDFTEWAS